MPVYDLPAIDIYCERLNLLLRSVNDLATTIGVRREKSKAGMLSKRLENLTHIPNKTSTFNYRLCRR